jgi:hypothetical protein
LRESIKNCREKGIPTNTDSEGKLVEREAAELAKKIIELDLLRDEIWEVLAELAGDRAHELLRIAQNS